MRKDADSTVRIGTQCEIDLAIKQESDLMTALTNEIREIAESLITTNILRARQLAAIAERLEMAPQLTEARGNDALRKALEFAEYMAKRAEQLLDRLSTEDGLRVRREESDDVSDDDMYDATTSRCEFVTGLRSGIYEFRKRAAKAAPQINAPAGTPALPSER